MYDNYNYCEENGNGNSGKSSNTEDSKAPKGLAGALFIFMEESRKIFKLNYPDSKSAYHYEEFRACYGIFSPNYIPVRKMELDMGLRTSSNGANPEVNMENSVTLRIPANLNYILLVGRPL